MTLVPLEAIDITRLGELVTDAWHMRAPAELKVEYPLVCGDGDPASIRGVIECHDARIAERQAGKGLVISRARSCCRHCGEVLSG